MTALFLSGWICFPPVKLMPWGKWNRVIIKEFRLVNERIEVLKYGMDW